MTEPTRYDAWQMGDSYERYMGRWSRLVGARFLDWLAPAQGLDWLEVGCGTGALSAAILERCDPHSLISVDRSQPFLEAARAAIVDPRVEFLECDAQALPLPDDSADMVVSALVLNFVPDMHRALGEMVRVARGGARVAFYVWDYPGRGLAFVSAFWDAASALDPSAAQFSERRRFSSCTADALTALAGKAGLASVECTGLEVPTVFSSFEDYWTPFTLGAGPAPGYCSSLDPADRQRLEDRLSADLPRQDDGSIALTARAWAVRGTAPR